MVGFSTSSRYPSNPCWLIPTRHLYSLGLTVARSIVCSAESEIEGRQGIVRHRTSHHEHMLLSFGVNHQPPLLTDWLRYGTTSRRSPLPSFKASLNICTSNPCIGTLEKRHEKVLVAQLIQIPHSGHFSSCRPPTVEAKWEEMCQYRRVKNMCMEVVGTFRFWKSQGFLIFGCCSYCK